MCDLAASIGLEKPEWATDTANRCWIISECGTVAMRQCLEAIIWKVPDLLFVQVDIIMISWGIVLKFLSQL